MRSAEHAAAWGAGTALWSGIAAATLSSVPAPCKAAWDALRGPVIFERVLQSPAHA